MSELRDAVEALYFAAHWSPDRPVDAKALWGRVRDAAGIEPGQTAARLGSPRSGAEIERLREVVAKCGHQFAFYAKMHREKGTPDGEAKARTNDDYARLCDEAIGRD